MVDVGAKLATARMAKARAVVVLPDEVVAAFEGASMRAMPSGAGTMKHDAEQISPQELYSPKGAVFQTAILAGVMAAKKTGDLIPLCHPLGLDDCYITIQMQPRGKVVIECTARVTAKTGVEMEALVGASLAALTIYDMCKALSHNIVIQEIRLLEKHGGKHDFVFREESDR